MIFDINIPSNISLFNMFKLFHKKNTIENGAPIIDEVFNPVINGVANNNNPVEAMINIVQILLYKEYTETKQTLAMYKVNAKTLVGEDVNLLKNVDLTEALFYRDYQKEHDNSITCIYDVWDYYIFASGEFEGTIGYYNGGFYKYDKKTKQEVATAYLTDDSKFWIIDGYIYYNCYEC